MPDPPPTNAAAEAVRVVGADMNFNGTLAAVIIPDAELRARGLAGCGQGDQSNDKRWNGPRSGTGEGEQSLSHVGDLMWGPNWLIWRLH